jgi:hypothetical protein
MITNGVDLPKLMLEKPELKNVPELKNGLGAGVSATDLIPFMMKSGVSPYTGPLSKQGIESAIVRVFCFRHER